VATQTDRDFDLWVGIDSLPAEDVAEKMGAKSEAIRFIERMKGSPAKIRQQALSQLIDDYAAIVFVDSDDLLYPTRVEAARKALERHEVTGCALTIIDERGADLGLSFGQTDGETIDSLLPRYNIFGMSNTAYRSDVLRRCLPLGETCEIVDWSLATRAWAGGANMHFDPQPQMAYRQYASNFARVLLPFTPEHVLAATRWVISHYRCLLESERPVNGSFGQVLREAYERAKVFQRAITASFETLVDYVNELNHKPPRYVWWWCVAHPELEYIWRN
jgi:hypothetical protein